MKAELHRLPMQTVVAGELLLEPRTGSHAEAMFELLSDPEIHAHLDDSPPPSLVHLREVYARQESRQSPDGRQLWLNWVLREPEHPPMGYVQATVVGADTAWIGYVLASDHRGRGLALRATGAMLEHLGSVYGVTRFLATVETENRPSIRLLERLGFVAATADEVAGHELSASERLFVLRKSPPAR